MIPLLGQLIPVDPGGALGLEVHFLGNGAPVLLPAAPCYKPQAMALVPLVHQGGGMPCIRVARMGTLQRARVCL